MASLLQIDTSAAPLYLKIAKGATFSYGMTMYITGDVPVDITGCTFSGAIRKTYGSESVADFSFEITDAPNGKVTWSLTADQTAAIPAGTTEASAASKYVFAVNIKYADDKVAALISGPCIVNPGASYA